MNWAERCVVVIPCLNEGEAIHALVRGVRLQLPRVLVVDDGSTDDTGKKAELAGAVVLRHEAPRGKGAGLQTGLARAVADGFSWALIMDGDGQHCPTDIPKFLRGAEETGARLIVGNRMENPTGMPWVRRMVNWWMSYKLSKIAGCRMPDTQCGYRLVELKAWETAALDARHFEVESEMLVKLAKVGCRAHFVAIQSIYGKEESKINPVQDTYRWVRWRMAQKKKGMG